MPTMPRLRALTVRRFAAVCLLAACAPSRSQLPADGIGPVPTGLTVELHEQYYDITGATPAELRRAMRERGPAEGDRRWDGYTRWNVRWRYRYAPRAGVCRMTDVNVTYTSTITLPRWSPAPSISPDIVREWRRFVSALEGHERGHRYIGADAAREVLRRIRDVQAMHCTAIGAEANALGQRILDDYRERQRAYDDETRHGQTQGALWPPRALR